MWDTDSINAIHCKISTDCSFVDIFLKMKQVTPTTDLYLEFHYTSVVINFSFAEQLNFLAMVDNSKLANIELHFNFGDHELTENELDILKNALNNLTWRHSGINPHIYFSNILNSEDKIFELLSTCVHKFQAQGIKIVNVKTLEFLNNVILLASTALHVQKLFLSNSYPLNHYQRIEGLKPWILICLDNLKRCKQLNVLHLEYPLAEHVDKNFLENFSLHYIALILPTQFVDQHAQLKEIEDYAMNNRITCMHNDKAEMEITAQFLEKNMAVFEENTNLRAQVLMLSSFIHSMVASSHSFPSNSYSEQQATDGGLVYNENFHPGSGYLQVFHPISNPVPQPTTQSIVDLTSVDTSSNICNNSGMPKKL